MKIAYSELPMPLLTALLDAHALAWRANPDNTLEVPGADRKAIIAIVKEIRKLLEKHPMAKVFVYSGGRGRPFVLGKP